ncbi:MAG: hypothetical protein U9532_00450 ['Conium maculatum' witches'-broom phytoplasma]|nr:hypothetical protein ['Conium maculatum' witches'-broom phytoplasma]
MWHWCLKIKMFILTLFLNISDFFLKFVKGFTVEEILAHRIDNMQTTIFTVLLITGFKPVFQLLINIIVFVKDIIMSCFFKQRKLNYLEKQEAKQEEKVKLLLQEIDKTNRSNQKLREQMATLTEKIGKKEKKMNEYTYTLGFMSGCLFACGVLFLLKKMFFPHPPPNKDLEDISLIIKNLHINHKKDNQQINTKIKQEREE